MSPEIVEEAMRVVRAMKLAPEYNSDGVFIQNKKVVRIKFTVNG